MSKSLIISWISACDYPLFREWLEKYNSYFNEILIYWDVQFKHPFYWAFIQQSLSHIKNIKFLDPVPYEYGVGDWRSTATNELVKHATGDWLISIEQDWFAKDWDTLLTKLDSYTKLFELIGWMNPTNNPYIHPAFFAIRRDLLEKTGKDFAAHPEINGSDHFAMITYKAKELGAQIATQEQFGMNFHFSPDADAFHLGGVNQNYLNGLTEGFELHRPEAFLTLNYENRKANVVQDPKFLELSEAIEKKYSPIIDVSNNEWTKFYK